MLDKIFTGIQPHTDPFRQDAWQSGNIMFFKKFDGTVVFNGVLSFRQGATTGQQSFEASDVTGMLEQMKTFLENLE